MGIAIFGWHFGGEGGGALAGQLVSYGAALVCHDGGGALAGQLVSYGAALVCHDGGPLSGKRECSLSWVQNLTVTTKSESSMSSIQGGRWAGSDSTSCVDSKREYGPRNHARDVKMKMQK
jgi:hypothetical protein